MIIMAKNVWNCKRNPLSGDGTIDGVKITDPFNRSTRPPRR